MRAFEEFLKQEVVRKKRKDEARARDLVESAEKRKKIMEKYLPLNEETAVKNTEECYDIIRELLEAKFNLDGYKPYSHEAVIYYLSNIGFSKEDVVFADKLREIRNGLKYYGKVVDISYAKKVREFLDRIYPKMKKNSF